MRTQPQQFYKKAGKKFNPHRRSIGVTFFIKDVGGDKQAVDILNM